jgi:hypothetical protein
MANIQLSILIITKDRLEVLEKLVDSIVSNAYDSSKIEIIFGIDYDDLVTKSFVDKLDFVNKRSYYNKPKEDDFCDSCDAYHINRHKSFLNPMAFMSTGEYIWVLNDDVTINSKNFDQIIYNKLNIFLRNKKTKFILAGCHEIILPIQNNTPLTARFQDGHYPFSNGKYFCYPIINRYTLSKLEFFIPSEISSDGGDHVLAEIFKNSLCDDRIIQLPLLIVDSRFVKKVTSNSKSHKNLYNSKTLMRDVKKINDEVLKRSEIVPLQSEIKSKVYIKCNRCEAHTILPEMNLHTTIMPPSITCQHCLKILKIDKETLKKMQYAFYINHNMNSITNTIKESFDLYISKLNGSNKGNNEKNRIR